MSGVEPRENTVEPGETPPDPRYAKRDEAVRLFKELGWEQLAWEDIPDAPLGDKAQRAALLAGLKSADWAPFGDRPDGTFGWHSPVEADLERLALLALRVGVPAPRADTLLHSNVDRRRDQLIAQLAMERGPVFAAALVERMSSSRHRFSDTNPTAHAAASVTIAETLGLQRGDQLEWLRDWACVAAAVLGGQQADRHGSLGNPPRELLRARFQEHAANAVAAGVSIEGSLSGALFLGLKQGWIERERLVDLAIAGLDAAAKQNQRRGWLSFLDTRLQATDAELAARAEALIPVLSAGDGPVSGALLPRLLPLVPAALLPDLALAGSTVTSRAQRAAVVAAFAALPAPAPELAASVLEALGDDRGNADAKLARAATRLWEAWAAPAKKNDDAAQLAGAAAGGGVLGSAAGDAAERGGTTLSGAAAGPDAGAIRPSGTGSPSGGGEETPQREWRQTPQLWDVPRLDTAGGSLPELGSLAGLLAARRLEHADAQTERFLALANRFAATDRDGVKAALTSVGFHWTPGLYCVHDWVMGNIKTSHRDTRRSVVPAIQARDAAVFARLGELPGLLSTPSWVDLRIDPAELLTRLLAYEEAGVAAAEGDLFLALLRTDPRLGTAELASALEAVRVPVLGRDGKELAHGAGALAARWLDEPLAEPSTSEWRNVKAPAWMDALPARTAGAWFEGRLHADAVPWWSGLAHARDLQVGLQAVRARPLEPVAARTMLSFAATEQEGTEARSATIEAFERGLLRPELVGAPIVDPQGPASAGQGQQELATAAGVPSDAYARRASGANELAEEGLGSVLWPLLDLTLEVQASAPRLAPGTADLAEAMAGMAPEAARAVERGVAPASVLAVPGLRALAARGGSARAPRAASQALAALERHAPQAFAASTPAPQATADPAASPREALTAKAIADALPLDTASFRRGFGPTPAGVPHVPDGAVIRAVIHDPEEKSKRIALLVALPAHPSVTFRVLKEWYYDLAFEGQCQAQRREDGVEPRGVYLHWDLDAAQLVVTEHRNWVKNNGGPLARHDGTPLPPWSVVATAAALSCALHEGRRGAQGVAAVEQMIELRRFHPGNVQEAARALFASDAVVPTRLTQIVEAERKSLGVLWPLLTEALAAAAEAPKPPRFTARVLDTALARLPHLAEATRRGIIPTEAWEPVRRLAAAKGSGAALNKARALAAALDTVNSAPAQGAAEQDADHHQEGS